MGKNSKKPVAKPQEKFKKIPNLIKNKLNPVVQKLLAKCTDVNANVKRDLVSYKEIFDILQEVQLLEKDYVASTWKREEHWPEFYKWCQENGAEFSAVSVKDMGSDNFGVVAERNIKKGDHILSIPRCLMISLEDARNSKLGPLISNDPILKHMPNVSLSLYLAMEAVNKNSFWLPYFSILPAVYDTVLYYTIEELKLLQRSPVIEKVVNTGRSVARQYAYFHQLFQNNAYAQTLDIANFFTYDLYRWAVSTVMTRQNGVPTEDGTAETTVLVPLFDMFNHALGNFSTDFNLTRNCLDSYAMMDFTKGEEVYIFYGPRSNSEFFIHNGFVYRFNENDWLELKLNIGKSDPLAVQKTELCSKKNVTLNGSFRLLKSGGFGEELLTFLKINVMKEDEVKEALENEHLLAEHSAEGKAIRQRALCFLKDRAHLLLKSYKTSIEEDEKLLASESNSHCQTAILLRICEKVILTDCCNDCEKDSAIIKI